MVNWDEVNIDILEEVLHLKVNKIRMENRETIRKKERKRDRGMGNIQLHGIT